MVVMAEMLDRWVLAAAVGTGAAWLVAMYRFPGSRWLDYALLFPLAIPAYVGAYALVDFLQYAGPVDYRCAVRRAGGACATARRRDRWPGCFPVSVLARPAYRGRQGHRPAAHHRMLLDRLDIEVDSYSPAPALLKAAQDQPPVQETLVSHLLTLYGSDELWTVPTELHFYLIFAALWWLRPRVPWALPVFCMPCSPPHS